MTLLTDVHYFHADHKNLGLCKYVGNYLADNIRNYAQSLSGSWSTCCHHFFTWVFLDQSHMVLLFFNGSQDYAQCVYDFQVYFLQILCTFRLIVLMNVLIHKHVQ